jgi:hypothetical protein
MEHEPVIADTKCKVQLVQAARGVERGGGAIAETRLNGAVLVQ